MDRKGILIDTRGDIPHCGNCDVVITDMRVESFLWKYLHVYFLCNWKRGGSL